MLPPKVPNQRLASLTMLWPTLDLRILVQSWECPDRCHKLLYTCTDFSKVFTWNVTIGFYAGNTLKILFMLDGIHSQKQFVQWAVYVMAEFYACMFSGGHRCNFCTAYVQPNWGGTYSVLGSGHCLAWLYTGDFCYWINKVNTCLCNPVTRNSPWWFNFSLSECRALTKGRGFRYPTRCTWANFLRLL